MKTYTLTITEEHLKLLSEITDKMARVIVGQLDYGIGEEVDAAIARHRSDGKWNDDFYEISKQAKVYLDMLHTMCWDQAPSTRYGVHYSKKSDALWDMHEVLRHQMWKENPDRSKMTVDSDKPFHWNKEIPLIKIELNDEI